MPTRADPRGLLPRSCWQRCTRLSYWRLGRLHTDGCLEYLGRQGLRVQIRGYRVEIAEVEAALRAHDALQEVAVIAREEPQQGTKLLAYFVPAHTPALSPALLRHAAATTLPDYMIPSAFIPLTALPMTPNDKVDRAALRILDQTHLESSPSGEAPQTTVEAQLVRLWREILGVEQVSIHDDFFALGGHSLLAMQLLVRVRALCHVDIPLATLVATPTIAALASAIREPGGYRLSLYS